MTKNPIYNALIAIAYIVVLVSTVFLAPTFIKLPDQSIFFPMAMLGTLVFSVALMAYVFFYQPVLMLIDGKRDDAIKFFLKTVATFAVCVLVLVACALFLTK